jgi:hypothetical protein
VAGTRARERPIARQWILWLAKNSAPEPARRPPVSGLEHVKARIQLAA